jgi:hypothetical protein
MTKTGIDIQVSYSVIAKCANCDYDGEVFIECGTMVKDTSCPNCCCFTLHTIGKGENK